MRALLLSLPLLLANAEDPDTMPPPIRAMLDAAMESGSECDVAVIAKYARSAAPDAADAVNRVAAAWRAARTANAQRTLREAGLFDLIKGRAEFAGYINTGNSENTGATAQLDLKREAVEWRHKLRLTADYRESLGVVSRNRYLASYEPNWKFDERAYLYGAAQYERDRFSGFVDRASVSTGIGYTAIGNRTTRLELEVGPAFRHTRFIDRSLESNVAGRGSIDLEWKVKRGITVRQNASAYLQDANSTVSTKSSLATKLIGPLSAQFSYALQYESMPPEGRVRTDTTSRAALVIDF